MMVKAGTFTPYPANIVYQRLRQISMKDKEMEISMKQSQEVKLIRMDMIQSQTIEWLWYPYIPFGKITIVQGDPGEGKTTFALNLAARVSKGECFGQEGNPSIPLSVIYQTAEDGLSCQRRYALIILMTAGSISGFPAPTTTGVHPPEAPSTWREIREKRRYL